MNVHSGYSIEPKALHPEGKGERTLQAALGEYRILAKKIDVNAFAIETYWQDVALLVMSCTSCTRWREAKVVIAAKLPV